MCLLQRNDKASYTILQRIPSPHGPDSRTLGLVCHDTQSFCAFPLKIAQLSYTIIKILKTMSHWHLHDLHDHDHRHDHHGGQHNPLSTFLAKSWSWCAPWSWTSRPSSSSWQWLPDSSVCLWWPRGQMCSRLRCPLYLHHGHHVIIIFEIKLSWKIVFSTFTESKREVGMGVRWYSCLFRIVTFSMCQKSFNCTDITLCPLNVSNRVQFYQYRS